MKWRTKQQDLSQFLQMSNLKRPAARGKLTKQPFGESGPNSSLQVPQSPPDHDTLATVCETEILPSEALLKSYRSSAQSHSDTFEKLRAEALGATAAAAVEAACLFTASTRRYPQQPQQPKPRPSSGFYGVTAKNS
jgi:hypothetical protein